MEIIRESVTTCPECGFKKTETMDDHTCRYFYQCENCKVVLKPLKGDCCVFCSFANVLSFCANFKFKKVIGNCQDVKNDSTIMCHIL